MTNRAKYYWFSDSMKNRNLLLVLFAIGFLLQFARSQVTEPIIKNNKSAELNSTCYTDSCLSTNLDLAGFYFDSGHLDSSRYIAESVLDLSVLVDNKRVQIEALLFLTQHLTYDFEYIKAYQLIKRASMIAIELGEEDLQKQIALEKAFLLRELELNKEADAECEDVLEYFRSTRDTLGIIEALSCFIGATWESSETIDEKPIIYEIIDLCQNHNGDVQTLAQLSHAYAVLSHEFLTSDSLLKARVHARQALDYAAMTPFNWFRIWPNLSISESYLLETVNDSAFHYLSLADSITQLEQDNFNTYQIYKLSTDYYASIGNKSKELEFTRLALSLEDQLAMDKNIQGAMKRLYIDEKNAQKKLERDALLISLAIGLSSLLLLSFVVFFAIRRIRSTKKILQHSKMEILSINEEYSKLYDRFRQLQSTRIEEEAKNKMEFQIVHYSQEKQKENYIALLEGLRNGFDSWEEFSFAFHQVDRALLNKLDTLPTSLSHNEMKIIALTHIGLSNKEIASIQNIQVSSVIIAKSRLKKKLALQEVSIDTYIKSL